MTNWFAGCSGFHYKHWKELFYPAGVPMRKWFAYYNQHFSTLELNVTFYRFPRLEYLEPWYNESSPNFIFSAKAPKAITHFKQFHNTQQMIADVYGTLHEGLKEKLGCVLFQLPPRLAYNNERLHRIAESMNPDFNNVLECRHESWWNEEVYKTLANYNITFCGMSHPLLPNAVVYTNSNMYYRFHGVPNLYSSLYSVHDLQTFAAEINSNQQVSKVFVYFNNDIGGSAIVNARQMNELIKT